MGYGGSTSPIFYSVLLIKQTEFSVKDQPWVRHATPGGSQALGFSRMARRAGLCDPWPGEAAVAMLAVAGGAAGETQGPRGTSLHINGHYLPLHARGLWRALGGHVLGASAWPSGHR